MKKSKVSSKPHATGPAALDSYADVLAFLTETGRGGQRGRQAAAELTFIQNVKGVESLFQTMSAVGAATSGASDEEWNPLSQRPHSPLPPAVIHVLGGEIVALKEAIDSFTTLAHEMMHVAVWEPFFVGQWRPRGLRGFREFSLLAEGFCFFFSDIVVSGAVRVRLPDGEYAMERQTSENARFHPARAFQALGIESHEEILDIYLEGFRGQPTRLWQPRGKSSYAAALAAQVYDFYEGSLPPLHELHAALDAFGGTSEFYRRFCQIPGLPTFLGESAALIPGGPDLKAYFTEFFRYGLRSLESSAPTKIASIRWRRMLQMRAYYVMQIRWLLSEELVVARAMSAKASRRLIDQVNIYLKGLESLLRLLAKQNDASPTAELGRLDAEYDKQVRTPLSDHHAWAGQRWMIVPRRAGGHISVFNAAPVKDRDAKIKLLQVSAFLVDELTRRLRSSKTVADRANLMAQLQIVTSLGAAGGQGSASGTRSAFRKLQAELARPEMLDIWSVPMASFDPVANQFRELVFSYQ